MSDIRHVEGPSGTVVSKTAYYQEVCDSEGKWWLYYSIGADLEHKVRFYQEHGYTLGEPETTGYLTRQEGPIILQGKAIIRRPLVKAAKGPKGDELVAELEEENEYPTFGRDLPVAYTRSNDGDMWLVYQRGPHMKAILDTLWTRGKAVGNLEFQVKGTDPDTGKDYPVLFKGKPCFRRLVVAKELGVNPSEFT